MNVNGGAGVMQQKDITWENFEYHNSDKQHSFENLCRLLFKHELCPEGTILTSEPNHAGVEVAPVISKEGKKISFQSKYFELKTDYEKIKDSANKTVKKYKKSLDVWYLYTNKSLSNCPSYQEIVRILQENGTDIVVVSNDEILTSVLKYTYIAETFFCVDILPFSWFENQVNNAISDLGIRYNEAFNVETDALEKMNLFLANEEGIRYVNQKKSDLIKSIEDHCNHLGYGDKANYDYIEAIYTQISALNDADVDNYQDAINWYDIVCNNVKAVYDIERQIRETEKDNTDDNTRKYIRELEWERDIIDDLLFTDEEIKLIKDKYIIVNGEAGMGKSQMLAMEAFGNIKRNQETILLLGEYFIETVPVQNQIMSKLGLDFDIRNLFSIMNVYGEIKNRPIVLFIDAINESEVKKIWKNGISSLFDMTKEYNYVRVVLSYRTGYEKALFSDGIKGKIESGDIATIRHDGFTGRLTDATKAFFNYYGVRFSPVYIIQKRMQNPLFLTIFCKTFKESHKCLSFPKVFEEFIRQANDEVKEIVGIDLEGDIVFDFLKKVVGKSIEKGKRYLDRESILSLDFWNEYGIVDGKTKFLSSVVRSGVLNDFLEDGKEFYDLGYDLLRDYVYALEILKRNDDMDSLYKYIENDLFEIQDGSIHNYGNKSIYVSILAMLSEEKNKELLGIIDSLDDGYDKEEMIDEYVDSLSWRDNSKLNKDYIYELVKKYSISIDTFINMLLENSLRVDSKLNAYCLHEMFSDMKLNIRDREWTIYINGLYDDSNRFFQLIDLLEHDLDSCRELDDKECELSLLLFGWTLASSNRNLRDHTSKALYNILYIFPDKISWFIGKFAHVNDFYITERVFCICLGVITKITDIKTNIDVAHTVYDAVFKEEEVVEDAKVREFAYLTIVNCIYTVGDIDGIEMEKCQPTYNSKDIPVVEIQDYKSEDYQAGIHIIASSMYPDKIPNRDRMYGDFGRYIFESCLSDFEDVSIENSYHYAMQYIRDELGYEDNYFSEYDRRVFHLNYYPGQPINIERIGKKYQWIALANSVAKISDNHNIEDYYECKEFKKYEGLWELYHLRDFDPTIFAYKATEVVLPEFNNIDIKYNCEDDSDEGAKLWVRNQGGFFESCIDTLLRKDSTGCSWVRLYTDESLGKKKKTLKRTRYSSERGDLYSWFQSIAFFAKKSDMESAYSSIKNTNFWGNWFPRENSEHGIMLGEYPWSPALNNRKKYEWQRAGSVDDVPHSLELAEIDIMNATIYSTWEGEYDASIEDVYSEILPCIELFEYFNLTEDKKNGCFFDNKDELIAFNSALFNNGQGFYIRADKLQKFLVENDYCMFWTLLGEHRFHCGEGADRQIWSEWSGYATFENETVNAELYDVTPNGYRY